MHDEYEKMYQEAVDGLDVKYIGGEAYMSIHTVDVVNASLMTMIDHAEELKEANEPTLPDETVQGMLWVMSVWGNLHDELELRAEAKTIPDTIPQEIIDADKG